MRVLFFTIVMLVASTSYAGESQRLVNGNGRVCDRVANADGSGIILATEQTVLDPGKAIQGEEHLMALAKAAQVGGLQLCFQMDNYTIERAYVK